MLKRKLTAFTAAFLATLVFAPLHAQIAQAPLVKQSETVSPNIMYIFDDSGSMASKHLYQYGGSAAGQGMGGPENFPQSGDQSIWTTDPTGYPQRSPDVNLIYYDPRITYSKRIKADGTYFPATITAPSTFDVYFYNPEKTEVYKVKNVVVNSGGSGYPASGVTATFNDAPVGGSNATATVTTAATKNVTAIDVTNAGRGYPTSVTVTIDPPPAGGVQATGKANLVNSGNVASVTVNSVGDNYPAGGVVTATFSPPQTAGGVNAAGTVTVDPALKVAGVTVTTHGSGYPASGKTVTFSTPKICASNTNVPGGRAATGTVNTATYYPVASVSKVSGGSGYTSNPTVTFSAPVGGGTTATGTVSGLTYNVFKVGSATKVSGGSGYNNTVPTVVISGGGGTGATATANMTGTSPNKSINSITITNAGSGYTSPPTISFTGGTGSGASFTAVMTGTSATVTGITLNNVGAGYDAPPTITLSGGGGTGASFTANLSTSGSVGISSITITDPGAGYLSCKPPTVTLGGSGGGSGAALSVGTTATNVITGIVMTENGSGYTSSPIITLSNVGAGSGAAFTSVTGTTRTVGSISITNSGVGYTSTPGCTITATSGSGATCSVTTGTTYVISSVTVTAAGSGYTSTPVLKLAGTGSGSGATFTVNVDSALLPGKNAQWNGAGKPIDATSYFTPSFDPYQMGDQSANSPNKLADSADKTIVYPNTASSAISKFPKFEGRTDCTSKTDHCTWTEEYANYTNWYNFHRTRLDLAKTGVGLAFQPLPNSFRLGWTALSTVGASGSTTPYVTAGVRPYDSTTEIAFFNWLNGLGSPGSTPSRYAMTNVGNYFMRKDDGGPWADDPPVCANCSVDPAYGTANNKHVSCRRSYAIFMTDGYYNDTKYSNSTDYDTPSTPVKNGAGYTLTAKGPYSDTKSGTAFTSSLADIAMRNWFTDLRPDLSNDIDASNSDDPGTWQHLNFSAIGLGLVGTLDAFDPNTLASLTDTDKTARTRDWPVPAANSQTSIDDMWHAVINGHGTLFNARNANTLKDSIRKIVEAIGADEDSQSGVAVSTVSLSTDTMKYTPWYTQGTWVGNVRAWHLNSSTASQICQTSPDPAALNKDCAPAWEIETLKSIDPITKKKTYASLIDPDKRNVYVGNGSTSGTRAAVFDTTLSTTLRGVMTGAVTVDDDVINYLRGSATFEDNDFNKGTKNAKYRERVSRLGDIVNSTPIFVYQNASVDYSSLPNNNGFSSYWVAPTYGADGKQQTPAGGLKGLRKEGMLFVGSNDGMFHGFRNGQYLYDSAGNVTSTPQVGGGESFAYIPRAILPRLNDLPSKTYIHRYYVDGPVTEADAYINGGWKNVVLASTGAGAGVDPSPGKSPGTSVFAIDVTNLNSDAGSTSFTASNVLWEVGAWIPNTAGDFAELGYMISDVRSGPMLDDRWVAIFGNGYESASCRAQLFVVNLENGALIKRIDTAKGDCGSNINGLGGVTLVRNDKKQIIGAYAGDLLGNMWKFNFNDPDPANWGLDFDGDQLFTASPPDPDKTKQPITAPPTVIDLADPKVWADGKNTAPKPGYMVVFGTGKFFESADVTNTDKQSLYGIWDSTPFGMGGTKTGSPRVDKVALVQQSTSTTPKVVDGETSYYETTKNSVDYSGKQGWYMDYNNSGERLVYPIDTLAYHYVAVGTIAPQGSINTCSGGSSGNGYLYVLDALWGGMPDENVLGVPGVNVMTTKLDGRNVSLLVEDPADFVYKVLTPAKDPLTTIKIQKPIVPATAKKVRKWRQLFMR